MKKIVWCLWLVLAMPSMAFGWQRRDKLWGGLSTLAQSIGRAKASKGIPYGAKFIANLTRGLAGMAADITGQVFGRLTVIQLSDERNRDRDRLWLCLCQCGSETMVIARLLRNGATQSCGCLRRERTRNLHRTRSNLSSRLARKEKASAGETGA